MIKKFTACKEVLHSKIQTSAYYLKHELLPDRETYPKHDFGGASSGDKVDEHLLSHNQKYKLTALLVFTLAYRCITPSKVTSNQHLKATYLVTSRMI